MFDKLIVTEPEGADFKNRSRYFMVSTLVVGVFFATAVVFSIYAAEIGLGNRDFELVSMLAPPDIAPVEPEVEQPRRSPASNITTSTDRPTRTIAIERMDQSTLIPEQVSTVRNTVPEMPRYPFDISKVNSDPDTTNGSGRNTGGTGESTTGLSPIRNDTVVDNMVEEIPPPVVKRNPPPSKTVSRGVLNGVAKNLPKPTYSAAARAVGAQGQVDVQVTIDESGRVVAANAVSGHILLRTESERAARSARFSPTYLSDLPVKVTGVITYNFVK